MIGVLLNLLRVFLSVLYRHFFTVFWIVLVLLCSFEYNILFSLATFKIFFFSKLSIIYLGVVVFTFLFPEIC